MKKWLLLSSGTLRNIIILQKALQKSFNLISLFSDTSPFVMCAVNEFAFPGLHNYIKKIGQVTLAKVNVITCMLSIKQMCGGK